MAKAAALSCTESAGVLNDTLPYDCFSTVSNVVVANQRAVGIAYEQTSFLISFVCDQFRGSFFLMR